MLQITKLTSRSFDRHEDIDLRWFLFNDYRKPYRVPIILIRSIFGNCDYLNSGKRPYRWDFVNEPRMLVLIAFDMKPRTSSYVFTLLSRPKIGMGLSKPFVTTFQMCTLWYERSYHSTMRVQCNHGGLNTVIAEAH